MQKPFTFFALLTVAFSLCTVPLFASDDDSDGSESTEIPTLSTLYNLTVSPANGSTIKSLSSFTVTFDDYSSVNSTSYSYVYSDVDLTTMVTYCKPSANGNTLTLTANAEITEAGTYYTVIKSGKVVLDSSSSTSENIVVTYTVDPNAEEITDGTEEQEDVTYTIKMVSPAEGAELEELPADYTLQFEITPSTGIGYAYYKVGTSADAGDLSSRASLTYNSETGYWEASVVYGVTLEKGDVYITAAAYATENDYNYGNDPLVKGSFVITGTAEAYEYSSVKVESVSPENESSISSQEALAVTIAFDGAVNISSSTSFVNYGQGTTFDFASIVSSDGATYSKIWTLTVSTSTLELFTDGVDLTVVATDESGARVYDTTLSEGEDAQTYLHLYYELADVGLTAFTIDPAEGEVTELSSFTLSYDGATCIAPTWNYYPTLYDADGNVVEAISGKNVSFTTTEVVFPLATTVTEAGTYKLVFPKKTVNINDNVDAFNAELTYTYTIVEAAEEAEPVEYTIKMVSPEEGEELETLPADFVLQFEIEPADSIGYAYYKIGTSEDAGDISSRSSLTYNEESGLWEASVVYDITLEAGTLYVTAAAYASEDDYNYDNEPLVKGSFTITGTAAEYEYSAVAIESLSPENESQVSSDEDLVVTIVFDGKVNINGETSFVNWGQAITYDFASIVSEDGEEYSTTWTLTASTETLANFSDGVDLSIVATDENGARVYDNTLSEGEDAQTYLHLYYEFSNYGLTDFTIDPAEGTVTELSSFTLSYDGATTIAPLWNYYPTLYDGDGNEVEAISGKNVSYTSSTVTFALSATITEAGTYQLVIPKKTVVVNDNLDSYNAELTYTYTIEEATEEDTDGIGGVTADLNGNYAVHSVSGVKVMTTSDASSLSTLPAGLYIVNGKKMILK